GLLLVDPVTGRALGPHTAAGSVMEVIAVPREDQVIALTRMDTQWGDLERGVSLGERLPALEAAAVDPTGTRLAGALRSALSDDFHGGSAVVMFGLAPGAPGTNPIR